MTTLPIHSMPQTRPAKPSTPSIMQTLTVPLAAAGGLVGSAVLASSDLGAAWTPQAVISVISALASAIVLVSNVFKDRGVKSAAERSIPPEQAEEMIQRAIERAYAKGLADAKRDQSPRVLT